MGPQLKVSSNRLVKPGIEHETPGLSGERFIHYTTAAPILCMVNVIKFGTLVTCQKVLDKQCRSRSDCFYKVHTGKFV